MFSIICLGVIALITVVAVIACLVDSQGGPPAAAAAFGVGLVLFIITWTVFSVATVGARQIGVVTNFGKVQDQTLDSGLHFTKPWESVEEIDGTTITQKYTRAHDTGSTDTNKECFYVQIGDLSKACVAGVMRYEHDTDKADDLFVEYRSIDQKSDEIDGINEAIQDALVRTQLTSQIGQTMRTFNPLIVETSQDGKEQTVALAAPDLADLTTKINKNLDDRLPGILLESSRTHEALGFTVTRLDFSTETNQNIERLQAQAAKTREAKEAIKTNDLLAQANDKLRESVSNDPNVIVAQCYTLVGKAMETGYSLPDNFQCWPGGSNAGVLVGANKG